MSWMLDVLASLMCSTHRYNMLTTTGDSRVRLWRLDAFETIAKFKGHTCNTNQIAASFAEDGRSVPPYLS